MYVFVIYSGTPLIRPPLGQKKKIGRINGVAVLTTVFFTRKCMAVFARQPKPLLYVIYF